MPGLVLDASATGTFLFRDEATPHTAALIVRIGREGAAVPAIWLFEVANLLRQGERRGRLDAAGVAAARALLEGLGVEVDRADVPVALGPVLDLARRHGLTAYDAASLELARRPGLPLATRDAALARGAAAEGVGLLAA